MTASHATWVLAAIALAGTILNIRKRKECFLLWIVSNAGWTWVNLTRGVPAQAFLFAVYLGLSFWGLYAWGAERRVKRGATERVEAAS